MKTLKIFLAAMLLGTGGLCFAISEYTTAISSLNSEIAGTSNVVNPFPLDPTPTPRVFVATPQLPTDCVNFIGYMFQLTDLTDPAQKQMYATLVAAKLNGLNVKLKYIPEGSMRRCRIVGVNF